MLDKVKKLSDSDAFTIVLENEPEKTRYWFRATEICDVLFTKNNTQRYITLHCKDWQYRQFQVGKGRPALYVCESGVYRLILRSKSPIALEFQDWITEELLPKLRASGGYIMPDATREQLQALKLEIEEKERLIEEKEHLIEAKDRHMHDVRHFFNHCLSELPLSTRRKEAHFFDYTRMNIQWCNPFQIEQVYEILNSTKFKDKEKIRKIFEIVRAAAE